MCILYIYIYIFTVHICTDVCFALSWAGSFWGLILFWWCFDAFLSFRSYQTLEVHVGNWTHGLWSNCQESISIDFMVWLMVKRQQHHVPSAWWVVCWWETHGDVSVVCKGFVLVGYVVLGWDLVGFVRGNHVAEIGSAGNGTLGSGASVVRRCRRLRPGGGQVGGGFTIVNTNCHETTQNQTWSFPSLEATREDLIVHISLLRSE